MNINKEAAKQYLAQGRVKEVIDFLLKNASDGYIKNNVILQANKYEKYKHNQINNLVSKQELDIDLSNIVLSLIKIIDSIEEEKPIATQSQSNQSKKSNILYKFIGWVAIIGVAWFAYGKVFPATPSAQVEISQILRETNGGVDGLTIKLSGDLKNFKNIGRFSKEEINMAVWFYIEDKAEYSWEAENPKLKDFNNKYSTTDAQVTVQSGLIKLTSNKISELNGSTLFIPISELHLNENYKDFDKENFRYLKNGRIVLDAGIFYNDEQIGRSDSRVYSIK